MKTGMLTGDPAEKKKKTAETSANIQHNAGLASDCSTARPAVCWCWSLLFFSATDRQPNASVVAIATTTDVENGKRRRSCPHLFVQVYRVQNIPDTCLGSCLSISLSNKP